MNVEESNPGAPEDLILRMPFTVTSADADMYARLRMGSLVNLLVQAATTSADTLDFGYTSLRKQKLFWVLSRLTVEISKPLSWYQSGEVETWPKDLDKILYLRDFIIRDQDTEVIARATSGWLAVDLEAKRPRLLEGSHSEILDRLRNRHALNTPPEKLFPVKEGETSEITAAYYDIDLNGHVTSSRYMDWMMDAFSAEFHKEHYPQKVSINFLNEIRPGETIRMVKNMAGETSFLFEGFNATSNGFAFRGNIEF
jgi:medium-chain acyl-[acyl-carrier-protein] hydrolase